MTNISEGVESPSPTLSGRNAAGAFEGSELILPYERGKESREGCRVTYNGLGETSKKSDSVKVAYVASAVYSFLDSLGNVAISSFTAIYLRRSSPYQIPP